MTIADLVITIAYFSIPVQILVTLYGYPKLARMPPKIFVLLVLFAFFIFLCGAGHLVRFTGGADSSFFYTLNWMTAAVSLLTALYLLPLIPSLMSSLSRTLQDLVDLNEETESQKRTLAEFLAFLCHELRNPLFSITSSVTFFADDEMTESQRSALGTIDQASQLMLRLVNDVLNIGRLDAGKLRVEADPFNLHDLLSGLIASFEKQVMQTHPDGDVVMLTRVHESVPPVVVGDSTRILQIVYNLLSNAFKVTPTLALIIFPFFECDRRAPTYSRCHRFCSLLKRAASRSLSGPYHSKPRCRRGTSSTRMPSRMHAILPDRVADHVCHVRRAAELRFPFSSTEVLQTWTATERRAREIRFCEIIRST